MSDNEVEIYDNGNDVDSAIAQLKSGTTPMYSSITTDTDEGKDQMLAAVMGSEPVAQHLGEVLEVKHLIVQRALMPNTRKPGNPIEPVARVVLITDDGKAYHAMSGPLFRDIQNIIAIKGEPSTWPAPVSIAVAQEGSGSSKYYTAKYVPKPVKK
jgi:hypothetical protein